MVIEMNLFSFIADAASPTILDGEFYSVDMIGIITVIAIVISLFLIIKDRIKKM